jgi:putative glutamine amidotransferase
MRKPVVGIIANFHLFHEQYPAQATGNMNIEAIAQVAGAIPMIVPAVPDCVDIDEIMGVCDGFLFTGGVSNVHPEEYGHEPTEAHGTFNRDRDRVTLPLIRACVEAGQPVLGVCRGFQEFNVAMGGTLHPEIRDLPGRMNHRMPLEGTLEERFAHRHHVQILPDSRFARIFGCDKVLVNSLHGQGIDEPGRRVIVDGCTSDGTAEAITIRDAPGFAMAVQWHPEHNATLDVVSKPLFEAFGDALMAWKHDVSSAAEQRP